MRFTSTELEVFMEGLLFLEDHVPQTTSTEIRRAAFQQLKAKLAIRIEAAVVAEAPLPEEND